MVEKEKLAEIEDKIRDLINQVEIFVIDEKIDEETAEEINAKLREIAEDIASLA
jgi:hypothetical protein